MRLDRVAGVRSQTVWAGQAVEGSGFHPRPGRICFPSQSSCVYAESKWEDRVEPRTLAS